MPDAALHLFVYGTLRWDSAHPMSAVVRRSCRRVGPGWLEGKLYQCGESYPGAVAEPGSGTWVTGELYVIDGDAEELFWELDAYELCRSIDPQPHEYKRVVELIRLPLGTSVSAWLYLYNLDTAGLTRIPSGDFRQR